MSIKRNLLAVVSGSDKIALLGSLLGLLALVAGWFTLKANRLAQGEHFRVVDVVGVSYSVFLITLWMCCFLLSFINTRFKNIHLFLGIFANVILVISALSLNLAAERLLENVASTSRVSLGGGVWLTFFAIYTVIFASYRKQSFWPRKLMVTLPGIFLVSVMLFGGSFDQLSILREYAIQKERFQQEFIQHIFLVSVSVLAAGIFGVILGIWTARRSKVEKVVFAVTNVTQTIPSLALFGLMIAPLAALSFQFPILRDLGIRGIGNAPAIIALFIYSLLPIIRNTFVSLTQIDRGIIESGRGMGMSPRQLFFRVELPLARPVVLEGLRIASVQAVGLTAVAALIGAGGLGWFIFQGLGQAAPDMVLLGTIPIIGLALVVDAIMRLAIKLGSPSGLIQR